MVARLLLFCCLVMSLPRVGQAQGTPAVLAWQNAYGTTRDETGGFSVAVPGGYLLLGEQSYFNGTTALLYFVRTNLVGDTLWTRRAFAGQAINPHITGFVRDAAGNLIVTGTQYDANIGFVLKFDGNCVPLWANTSQLTTPAATFERTAFVHPVISSDGNYVVIQNYFYQDASGRLHSDESFLKIAQATGATMWNISIQSALPPNFYGSSASAVLLTSAGYTLIVDGSLAITGSSPPRYSVAIGMIDVGASGIVTRFRTALNPNIEYVFATFRAADGSTVLAGRETLTKLNAAGDTLWHTVVPSRYPGRQWDGNAVTQDAQGNYVVAGTSRFVVGGSLVAINVHLARFRPDGRVVNDTMLYRPGQTYAAGLLLAPNGQLVVTGQASNGPRGGIDLFAFQFRGFRPLASRAAEAVAAGLAVYPNPSAGAEAVRVALPAAAGRGELALFDALGRAVRRQPLPPAAREAALDVAGLPPGLYVLRLSAASGQSWTSKLVRE